MESELNGLCAALYLRKSRADKEAEARGEGETLKRHKKMLIEYAYKHHIKIGETYEEVRSGESIEARPEMQRLLKDVEAGKWQAVLVIEVERLARGNTKDQGIVSEAFQYSNTLIITPMKTYHPNDECDEEYFEFGLFMSRREYKVINRRLQRGRVSSVKEGKYVGNIPPYGYNREKLKNDKGYTLVKNSTESRVVKLIFDLYVENNYSMNQIAKELNCRNISTRKGKKWTVNSIKSILHNPVYIGKIRWNARKTVKRIENGIIYKSRPRNKDYLLIDGLHSPIIPKKLWDKAQEIINLNHIPLPSNTIQQNSLRSLIYCKKCGYKMQRRPYQKMGLAATLICINPECNNISSKFEIVEEVLLDGLKKWLKDYKINHNKNILFEKYHLHLSKITNQIQAEEKKLLIIKEKQSKIHEFLEDGLYTKQEFLDRKNQLEMEQHQIQLTIEDLTKESQKTKKILANQKNIVSNIQSVVEIYYSLNNAKDQNELLKKVIEKVTYLKTEKAIKKISDPKNFELNIYPKVY